MPVFISGVLDLQLGKLAEVSDKGSHIVGAEEVKRKLLGMVEAGEPLLRQALDAIRAHNDAQAPALPAKEIERLRLKADHLYQTVIDYQLYCAGTLGESVH